MVNKLIGLGVLLIVLLAGCAVTAAVLRPTADTAVTRLVDSATAPDPLADAIKVYTTVGGGDGRSWAAIALTFVVLTAIGSTLAYLYLRPRYFREKRLLKREDKRRGMIGGERPSSSPQSWVLPQIPQAQQPPALPRMSNLPALPEETGDDGNGRNWLN